MSENNMKLVLYTADCTGNQANCLYPNRVEITSGEQLKEAIQKDHVSARYQNNYRSNDNFMEATAVFMDNDNDFSDDPKDWITAEKLSEMLGDVDHAIAPSRHNMQEKDGKSARPRQHVYFPIHPMTDRQAYQNLKAAIQKKFPFFDANALDAARFFFGSKVDQVIWNEGWMTIDELITPEEAAESQQQSSTEPENSYGPILQGSRNKTMSHFAGRVLKRYGLEGDKAKEVFEQHASKCEPPLSDEELNSVWNSAVRFYRKKVMTSEGYVPPDQYNQEFIGSLKPADYSDVGQAKMFSSEYGPELIYTSATDFLRFDGTVWVEDKQLAVSAMIEFLDLQLADARDLVSIAADKLKESGIGEEQMKLGGAKLAKAVQGDQQLQAYLDYLTATKYLGFVMKRRDKRYLTHALELSKAILNRSINDMDQDPNLLNTPSGTYDLAKGLDGCKEHDAADLITKITECAPSEKGKQLWQDSLNLFFTGNQELIDYVQLVVGMAAVGKVYQEHLIIAYGDGANGKSTFWNTIARCLGSYSGKISAEVLTVGNKRNAKPEMAELKGKRLIIASEMEEGMRLNTAVVKQLCSTDPIQAEKKFEKPFDFIPTHTLVLYTNHLPRVGANDDGIWRRLIVIPFNAKITGSSDIKNYGDYLFDNAGPAIMSWIIEGAKKAIACDFKWANPTVIEEAIEGYREQNDWFAQFLEDCCDVDPSYEQKSGAFYDEYRAYCQRMGDYARNTVDFYSAVEKAGLIRKKKKDGRYIIGARLKPETFTE